MMRQIRLRCCVVALVPALALAAFLPAAPARVRAAAPALPATAHLAPGEVPAVDPDYIYNQLAYMATHFQHREAGYDMNLPPLTNGHDEFAAYWASEMQRDLVGFGATVSRDPFAIAGWPQRPAKMPAVNIEVTVPGLAHPEQVVIIGCHYDGEAISTQSANDDASGCAIELGVAKAMAAYWHTHALYPARTLRFVLYDAEEQGLYGSFHAVNTTANGDLGNIVAMFNEEQSGIGYPLRFLGNAANPTLPMYAVVSPLQDNDAYQHQDALSPQQHAAITSFRALLRQAIPAVFAEFRALGYTSLAYHDTSGQPISQPIFTPDQTANVQLADDDLAASDEFPYTLAGLPCATFLGNFTYYDKGAPPPWSYPYDQPQDTIQLMNTYANGTAEKAPALTLSLALPGMLTTWMLAQPPILGGVTGDGKPLAAISDIGTTVPGQPLAVDASASYNPGGPTHLSYSWTFGDETAATGVSVTHTYRAAGTYTLTLTVHSSTGSRSVAKTLTVTDHPPVIVNPFGSYHPTGHPRANPNVALPGATPEQAPPTASTAPSALPYALLIVLILAILLGGIAFLVFRGRRAIFAGKSTGPRARTVYLSYAPDDATLAAPILRALHDSHLTCWHDGENTSAAGELSPIARRQLAQRAVFIRLCSPRAQACAAVQAETAAFRQLQAADRQQGHPDARLLIDIILDAAYQPTPGEHADLTINAANRPTSAWITALDQRLGTLHATRQVSRGMLTIVVGIAVLLAFLFLVYIAFHGHYIFRNSFPQQ